MKTQFLDAAGIQFYVEETGTGQPIVLIHAGIADSCMWDGQVAPFSRHGRVIRYDRRGFGKTSLPHVQFSHHQDLHDLLESMAIIRPILIGCSQGGKTALDLELLYPGTARALVLVSSALSGSPPGGVPPRQIPDLEAAEAAGDLDAVNELEMQIWVDGPQRTADQVDPRVRALAADMNRTALTMQAVPVEELPLHPPAARRLAEIKVPTLVLFGDLDQPHVIQTSQLIAESIPGARMEVIPGTAHLPNMEQPDLFNQHVVQFITHLPD